MFSRRAVDLHTQQAQAMLRRDLEQLAMRHDPHHVQHCPISLEPIHELPINERALFIDGECYNKTALLTWLSQQPRAPLTNLPMSVYEARYPIRRDPKTTPKTTRCFGLHLTRMLLLLASSILIGSLLVLGQYPLHHKAAQTGTSIILFAAFLVCACSFCFCPLRQTQQRINNDINVETRFAPFMLSGPALVRAANTLPFSSPEP